MDSGNSAKISSIVFPLLRLEIKSERVRIDDIAELEILETEELLFPNSGKAPLLISPPEFFSI